jgi:hypothetical protein
MSSSSQDPLQGAQLPYEKEHVVNLLRGVGSRLMLGVRFTSVMKTSSEAAEY